MERHNWVLKASLRRSGWNDGWPFLIDSTQALGMLSTSQERTVSALSYDQHNVANLRSSCSQAGICRLRLQAEVAIAHFTFKNCPTDFLAH